MDFQKARAFENHMKRNPVLETRGKVQDIAIQKGSSSGKNYFIEVCMGEGTFNGEGAQYHSFMAIKHLLQC